MRLLVLGSLLLGAACSERRGEGPAGLDPSDFDRDGFHASASGEADCDDRDPSVRPDAVETCDGRDEDCDGVADDGFDCVAGSERECGLVLGMIERCTDTCTWGACGAAGTAECTTEDECRIGETAECEAGCGTGGLRRCGPSCAFGACEPPPERCNGVDDDCDGSLDEGTLGLAGPLRSLPWTGPAREIAAAAVGDRIFVATSLGNDWATPLPDPEPPFGSWLDSAGEAVGDPILLDSDPDARALWLDVVAVDDEAAVVWMDHLAARIAWVGGEGVRTFGTSSSFLAQFTLVWTGAEVVATDAEHLVTFDQDANATRDFVPLDSAPSHGSRVGAAWTEEGIVLVGLDGIVGWWDLDGSLVREVDLDFRAEEALVAADGADLLVSWRFSGMSHLARLDSSGAERWRVSEPVPDEFVPLGIHRWGDRSLVLAAPFSYYRITVGGWTVDDTGMTLDAPDWWTWFVPGGFSLSADFVSIGDDALVFVTDDGALVAPVGCAAP